jgi:hypothetical protein
LTTTLPEVTSSGIETVPTQDRTPVQITELVTVPEHRPAPEVDLGVFQTGGRTRHTASAATPQ